MTLNEAIGKTVRSIRHDRKLTLFDVCEAAGFAIRESHLSMLERGRKEWKATTLEVVSSALRLQPHELLPKE